MEDDGGHPGAALGSRAAALGWGQVLNVAVVVGSAPAGEPETVVDAVKRSARQHRLEAITGVQGDRLVVVLGRIGEPLKAARAVVAQFGRGPVVVGPLVRDLSQASHSAAQATASLRVVAAWPDAPRPVAAADLVPERALAGDADAQQLLVHDIYDALVDEDPALLTTVSAYLERVGSLEGTARELFVHANTVRYRLKRVTDVTGLIPTDPRDAWSLRLAMTFGRLRDSGVTATTSEPVRSDMGVTSL